MKILFLLLLSLISAPSFGDVTSTYSALATLKNSNQLIPNTVYIIQDLKNMQLVAKSPNSFYEKPLVRTVYGIDFDEENFNFNTKVLTGIDNIACTARNINSVWVLINNVGIKPHKVAAVGGNLTVYFAKTYHKILGFDTVIDETYSASNLNISLGASVGLSSANIKIYKTVGNLQKVLATPAELAIPQSNIFINGKLAKYIQL